MSPTTTLLGSLIASLVVTVTSPASSQRLEVDLATTKDMSAAKSPDTVQALPGTYRIVAYNIVQRWTYVIVVSQLPIAIPPLQQPTAEQIRSLQDHCARTHEAIQKLQKDTAETDVPYHIDTLRTAIHEDSADTNCPQKDLDVARQLIKQDTLHYGGVNGDKIVSLTLGSYVVVTVTRESAGGRVRTWQRVYSSGPKGEWRLTYGFGVPVTAKIWGWFPNALTYYAKQVGTGSTYVITRNRVTSHLGPVAPAVFYTFMPPTEPTLSLSPAAGLGFDLQHPVVFLGAALTFKSNVQASAGVTLHQESVLMGRYNEGDTVMTNLTADQLSEKVYRLRPYFAVAFRFSNNPFGGAKSPGTEAQPQDSTPKPK